MLVYIIIHIILYIILYYTLLFFLLFLSFPILLLFFISIFYPLQSFSFILYVSGLPHGYLYTHPIFHPKTIRPRMFYRSGWLRCDVFKCIGFCFMFGAYRVYVWGLTYGVTIILYYILYIIIHTRIYYILLYYIILLLLLYIILYSSVLPSLSSLIHSFPSSLLFLQYSSHPHSKYTCRHLDILIYIESCWMFWPRMFYRMGMSSGAVW